MMLGTEPNWLESFANAAQRVQDAKILLALIGLDLACIKLEREAARDENIQAQHELDLALSREHKSRLRLAEKELQERLES